MGRRMQDGAAGSREQGADMSSPEKSLARAAGADMISQERERSGMSS
jgi:hypothetical protein